MMNTLKDFRISKKIALLSLGMMSVVATTAQNVEITGEVKSIEGNTIPFANIYALSEKKGTSADVDGKFKVSLPAGKLNLRVSAMGFEQKVIRLEVKSDTTVVLSITESEDILNTVVVSGTLDEVAKRESPIPIEVYSASYLNKVPVAGLLEATQNINGVRPQLNCAVCNTGDIHINGMEGPYTMVTIDGMPMVGGLATVYGLQGIPSSLLERVEVVKGPASTLYGSEAVAGLINVITKSVDQAPDLSVDVSLTSWQELQTDMMVKYAENKKVSGIFGVDYHNYTNPIDNNGDNFTDLTIKDRVSLFNKLQFNRKDNKVATLMTRYLHEDRWGGEMQWTPEFRGGDSIYGESIYTDRVEVIGNYQLPTKEKIIASGSYSYHKQDSYYGDMSYNATQQIGYGQLVWHKNAGTRNKMLTGIALRYNYYDDNTQATASTETSGLSVNQPDSWYLPGVFVQDNLSFNENLKLLLGARFDYHTRHGAIFSPRVNWKWTPGKETAVRLGYGNGFRVVNVFTEDHAALTGARTVVFEGELLPERSHNMNLNIEKRINTDWTFITLDGSVFYTYFTNKIAPDYDSNDDQIIYANLDGYAISRGVSLNARFIFEIPLKISFGGTLLDVSNIEDDGTGTMVKTQQMLTEPYTGTWSVSYRFAKPEISIDYTGNLYGPMRLPILENDFRPEYSDPFSVQNIKVTKEFKSGFEIYGGVRNLLNFTPPAYSIMRAHDPFDRLVDDPIDNPNGYSFDPAYIYTSFQGITFFGGLKYTLDKK